MEPIVLTSNLMMLKLNKSPFCVTCSSSNWSMILQNVSVGQVAMFWFLWVWMWENKTYLILVVNC